MADMYEKRSGKATRQKHEKDRRDKVVQVRMSDADPLQTTLKTDFDFLLAFLRLADRLYIK